MAFSLPLLGVLLACAGINASAKTIQGKPTKSGRYEIRHKEFYLRLMPRTPEQISAFYYGRRFPERMIKRLQKVCFITVGMKNLTRDILWLDFTNWTFTNNKGQFRIMTRKSWLARWKKLGIPLNHQATFRWTVLPPGFDFQPGEREGGNIILPRKGLAFTIRGKLHRGQKRDKGTLEFEFRNVRCATDPVNKPKAGKDKTKATGKTTPNPGKR